MKELKVKKQDTPYGAVTIKLRIIGKKIYIKSSQSQHAEQFISQYRSKGADVLQGKNWTRIDLFKNRPSETGEYTLSHIKININKDSENIIEEKLHDYYVVLFGKSGFEIK